MIVFKQKRIINKKYKVTHEKINFSQEDGTFLLFIYVLVLSENYLINYLYVKTYFNFIKLIKYFNLLY